MFGKPTSAVAPQLRHRVIFSFSLALVNEDMESQIRSQSEDKINRPC
jgi:hypothetical protein